MGLAVAGVAAISLGTFFAVRATEHFTTALGISRIVGGLFVTAPVAVMPELFAVCSVTRSGQVTAATASVIGYHGVALAVAFFPLALVGVPVQDLLLFSVNPAFVALVPAVYATLIHWGRAHGFRLWEVLTLDGLYLLYLAIMLVWVLNVV